MDYDTLDLRRKNNILQSIYKKSILPIVEHM